MGNRKLKRCILWLIVMSLAALPTRQGIQVAQKNRLHMEKMELCLDAMGTEGLKMQKNLARWYNYNLDLGTQGLEAAYESILDLGDGGMAVLEIPQMKLRIPVFHGENGLVGHLPESDIPIGVRGDHTVLTMKIWYPWEEGMTVYIECLGSRYAYRVESLQVMPSGWSAAWPSEQDRLTIIHDWGEKRMLIRCVRCGELTVQRQEERSNGGMLLWLLLLKIPGTWMRRWFRDRKYSGFYHKNRRKSKLL